jgi:hypothetical protein
MTPAIAIVGVVAWLWSRGEKWAFVLLDPSDFYEFPVFAGLFSHAGVLALTAVSAIALFAWGQLRGDVDRAGAVGALGLVGLLSALLALDDMFLLHERVLRHGLHLHEMVVYSVYGAIGAVILWKIRDWVLTPTFLPLWGSLALLAGMVLLDRLEKVVGTPGWLLLGEETLKLTGFVLWSGFWIAFAHRELRRGART